MENNKTLPEEYIRCGNCKFSDEASIGTNGHTICRKNPPMHTVGVSPWPQVNHLEDWCGSFEEGA